MDILTHRLRLRQLEVEDASWIAEHIANPKVHRWLTAPPKPYLLVDAIDFIHRNVLDPRYRVVEWNDAPCGVVSLTTGSMDLPDLGYWLAEHAWGHGLMTEAARGLLAWQFNNDPSDIRSGWISGNAASENVLTKLGFQVDGSIQARSEYHDQIVTIDKVRLTQAAWQALSVQH